MILAIDYGEKRIGLAIADEENKIPLPFKILENKSEEFVLSELKKIILEKKIGQFVVGLPFSLSGKEGRKAGEVREFIKKLQTLGIPIKIIDERFSSRLADALGGEDSKNRDIGAAMVILEDYLSRQSL